MSREGKVGVHTEPCALNVLSQADLTKPPLLQGALLDPKAASLLPASFRQAPLGRPGPFPSTALRDSQTLWSLRQPAALPWALTVLGQGYCHGAGIGQGRR